MPFIPDEEPSGFIPDEEQSLTQTPSTSQERERAFGTISARPGLVERSLEPAGQILGGLAGLRGGTPGVVVGATAGTVGGRFIQQHLRRQRGEEITPSEQIGELAGTGALTAAVETTFPLVGKALSPIAKPVIERVMKKTVRPGVENVLRFMTGITPENTGRLLERGPSTILNRSLRSRERGIRIAEQFLTKAQDALQTVNTQWAKVVKPLEAQTTSQIPSQPIRDTIVTTSKAFLPRTKDILPSAKDVFKLTRGVFKDLEQVVQKPVIPLRQAIAVRQQLDDVLFTGQAQGLLTPRQKTALEIVRRNLTETIHNTFPEVAKVDAKREVIGRAFTVIEKFSPESITNVSRLGRMIDAFENIDPAFREALQEADRVIANETGQSLLGLIRDRTAAVAFEPTELRAVRTWIIGAVLAAFGFTTGGPLGGAAATGLGITLSSPRLAGMGLRGLFAAGRGLRTTGRTVRPTLPAAATSFLKRFTPLQQSEESP